MIKIFRIPAEKNVYSHCRFPTKCNNTAHYLTGTITFAKDEYGKKVDSYPVKYILSEGTAKKSGPPNGPEKTKLEECQESVRDMRTQWLTKMGKYWFVWGFYRMVLIGNLPTINVSLPVKINYIEKLYLRFIFNAGANITKLLLKLRYI